MMTTMAALLGGVPLTLGAGTGAEIRQPLGYAIVGGRIVSQALTLYTTPIVFRYLDRLNAWFTGASRPKAARMAGGSADLQIPPGCHPARGGITIGVMLPYADRGRCRNGREPPRDGGWLRSPPALQRVPLRYRGSAENHPPRPASDDRGEWRARGEC